MQYFPWWNEAQRKLADEAKQVVDEILIPMGEKCAWKKEYPWEATKEIAKRGWFGPLIPEEYGGRRKEWGVTGACIIAEEIGRAGEVSGPWGTTIMGGIDHILHAGTEEQKRRWLPRMAKGELLGCITMTEPFAGSDIAAAEISAVRKDDVYVVNGRKRFQTGSAAADIYMTFVKTSNKPEDVRRHRHLTGLVIEKGMPGFTVERVNDLMGFDGIYNCYLNYDNVQVPVANRIGEEGDGWRVMMSGLNTERAIASATVLGPMRELLRYSVQHLQRRVQFGQLTGDVGVNQAKIADMMANLTLARLNSYYTAYLSDLGQEIPVAAASAKLFSVPAALQGAIDAIQIMGGNGVTRYYPVERIFRDQKLTQIAAGTDEILRLVVYRMALVDMADDLKVPRRVIDDELKVPMPLGKAPPPVTPASEDDVLKVLAEDYRVNPGLHMSMADLKEQLDVSDEDLNKYLLSLEEKGLANLFRDRRGVVSLARATNDGLAKAHPPEYYRYIPAWVNQKDMF